MATSYQDRQPRPVGGGARHAARVAPGLLSRRATSAIPYGVLLLALAGTHGLCTRAPFQATLQAVTPSIALRPNRSLWSDAYTRCPSMARTPCDPVARPVPGRVRADPARPALDRAGRYRSRSRLLHDHQHGERGQGGRVLRCSESRVRRGWRGLRRSEERRSQGRPGARWDHGRRHHRCLLRPVHDGLQRHGQVPRGLC